VGKGAQLFRLFGRPAAAMGAILDQGSLLFATCAVIIVSLLSDFSLRGALSIWTAVLPLLALSVVYVPGTLLVTNLVTRQGSLSAAFERDYSPLLTCAAMAWTAINIPMVIAGWLLPLPIVRVVGTVAYLYFAVLMIFAVRTVFGTETRIAVGVVSVSWIPLVAAAFLWGPSISSCGGSPRHSCCFLSFTIFAESSRTWAQGCAAGNTSAGCSKRRLSTRMMATRSISLG